MYLYIKYVSVVVSVMIFFTIFVKDIKKLKHGNNIWI